LPFASMFYIATWMKCGCDFFGWWIYLFSLEASVRCMPTFPKHVPRMDVKEGMLPTNSWSFQNWHWTKLN
jgi:hypothetical protein